MSNSKNIDIVIQQLYADGITNPVSIAAILSIIRKESGFIPKSENNYSNTSNARIKKIFSSSLGALSDSELTALKKDPVKFFNKVYGGKYGNSATEGYKYRGRGFNQLTFKSNYAYYGKLLGLDLINNPDLVNDPKIAARIVGAYFKKQFSDHPAAILDRYQAKNINDFKDPKKAVNAFYNANAGLGKDTSNIMTEGKKLALASVNSIYNLTSEFLNSPGGKIAGGGLLAAACLFFFFC